MLKISNKISRLNLTKYIDNKDNNAYNNYNNYTYYYQHQRRFCIV